MPQKRRHYTPLAPFPVGFSVWCMDRSPHRHVARTSLDFLNVRREIELLFVLIVGSTIWLLMGFIADVRPSVGPVVVSLGRRRPMSPINRGSAISLLVLCGSILSVVVGMIYAAKTTKINEEREQAIRRAKDQMLWRNSKNMASLDNRVQSRRTQREVAANILKYPSMSEAIASLGQPDLTITEQDEHWRPGAQNVPIKRGGFGGIVFDVGESYILWQTADDTWSGFCVKNGEISCTEQTFHLRPDLFK